MQWDNWAQQTYDVFKAVLLRPRFGLTLSKEAILSKGKVAYFRSRSGDIIACAVFSGRLFASVRAFEVSDLEDPSACGRFSFQTMFYKANSNSMRKDALKLAKKISQKEIYDVMHS